MMADVFRYFNINCEVTASGKEAIEALDRMSGQQIKPDLIITDNYMPGMNGIQLAREVRHHHNYDNPVILMLSSMEKNLYQHEADKAGIQNMLTKPVKLHELYALMTPSLQAANKMSGSSRKHHRLKKSLMPLLLWWWKMTRLI